MFEVEAWNPNDCDAGLRQIEVFALSALRPACNETDVTFRRYVWRVESFAEACRLRVRIIAVEGVKARIREPLTEPKKGKETK